MQFFHEIKKMQIYAYLYIRILLLLQLKSLVFNFKENCYNHIFVNYLLIIKSFFLNAITNEIIICAKNDFDNSFYVYRYKKNL